MRFGYLDVRGGQFSQNEGVDFARQTGLLAVTSDARDVGYPQVSLSGVFSTMGDPTTFTRRHNTSLELRWEIFNVLNRTNFNIPNRIAFTPNFGRIFSAQNPRQMQFGARVSF